LNETTKDTKPSFMIWFRNQSLWPQIRPKICDNAMRASEYGIKKPESNFTKSPTWMALLACMKVMLN
jgi:hypothetical protein